MSPPELEITILDSEPALEVELIGNLIIQENVAPNYLHQQSIPAEEWIVNHNLGFRPNYNVSLAGGISIHADVLHFSLNQLRIYWVSAQTGFVRCH